MQEEANRIYRLEIMYYFLYQKIPLASRKISVPRGTFLFMGIKYINQAITTEQQINILKERDLFIDDAEQAIEVLDNISYFRLSGYWRHFEADRITHQFRAGSRFADIIDLYSFDKELRTLLFTTIQTIEVSVRTKIIKHFALEFGAFWFMDESYATTETRFDANLSIIRKEVSRSHDDFITEHFRKYSESELPPVWKTLEVISMGTLSKLYSNFSDATAKYAVAREFGLNHHIFLRSWLECLAVLRNCCAHHSRLIQPRLSDATKDAGTYAQYMDC